MSWIHSLKAGNSKQHIVLAYIAGNDECKFRLDIVTKRRFEGAEIKYGIREGEFTGTFKLILIC